MLYLNTMTPKQFETHIKSTISQDLYVEETPYRDIERVMLANTPKGNLYICAIPKELQVEHIPTYMSDNGQVFPNQEQVETKIKHFIEKLPAAIAEGLYNND